MCTVFGGSGLKLCQRFDFCSKWVSKSKLPYQQDFHQRKVLAVAIYTYICMYLCASRLWMALSKRTVSTVYRIVAYNTWNRNSFKPKTIYLLL